MHYKSPNQGLWQHFCYLALDMGVMVAFSFFFLTTTNCGINAFENNRLYDPFAWLLQQTFVYLSTLPWAWSFQLLKEFECSSIGTTTSHIFLGKNVLCRCKLCPHRDTGWRRLSKPLFLLGYSPKVLQFNWAVSPISCSSSLSCWKPEW